MEENKQLEKVINRLKTNYKYIFNTDEGKEVLVDLEKRCHWNPVKRGDHPPISVYEFLRLICERHQTQLSKPFRAWI